MSMVGLRQETAARQKLGGRADDVRPLVVALMDVQCTISSQMSRHSGMVGTSASMRSNMPP